MMPSFSLCRVKLKALTFLAYGLWSIHLYHCLLTYLFRGKEKPASSEHGPLVALSAPHLGDPGAHEASADHGHVLDRQSNDRRRHRSSTKMRNEGHRFLFLNGFQAIISYRATF